MDRVGRCTARAKSTGARCNRQAIAGGAVCPVHGGRAPQVRAAAARRLAEADAAATLAELVPADAPPVANVAAELGRLAGELVAARGAAAGMVRHLDNLADPSGDGRPEVALWLGLIDRCGRLLEAMARLGIDAQRSAVEARHAEILADVMARTIGWVLAEVRAGSAPAEIEAGWRPIAGAHLRSLDEGPEL
ncbi:hypothetical protein [Iamia sp.]|uniref:hypothetical protein n=1 Tax=Iamia sp. TaxID=2722710 RepID=UPI002CC97757|nr:hypothetical protein [Iamia sp.]HXH58905.1 hypothetical protein [Iamia sp.]